MEHRRDNQLSLLRRNYLRLYFLTMPLHAWMLRGRPTYVKYKALKASEFWDRSRLDELQIAGLQEIVSYAYEHSRFYKDKFDQMGIHPRDIQCLADLQKLPLLSKDEITTNLNDGLVSAAVEPRNRLKITTSGSTGRPFTIYADREQLETRFAATLRAMEMTGWRIGDKQARLWHQTIGMTKVQIIRERVDALLMRRIFVPAFEISSENITQLIKRIRRHDPVLIDGYAESLNFLASFVKSGGVPGFSPKAIISSAQGLPDNIRSTIEDAFQTKVHDKYGSREFSGIAYECGYGRDHHVVDECYIVEILVDNRPAVPGETGEIVITDLRNLATPMIRYRIGDLAVEVDNTRECECGRQHRRIGRIEGRTQAIVHCADGTWLPSSFFLHFLKDYEDQIKLFQIEHDSVGVIELKVVKNDDFDDEKFNDVIRKLKEFTGLGTEVNVRFVDEIPLVRTGKRSPVVSTVRSDFQSLPAHVKEEGDSDG